MNNYVFLADFLAKFSSFSDPIKAIAIVTIGAIFISFFYFIKQIIIELAGTIPRKPV